MSKTAQSKKNKSMSFACNLCFGTPLLLCYQKNNSMKCNFFCWIPLGSGFKYIWVGFLTLPIMSCIFWREILPLHLMQISDTWWMCTWSYCLLASSCKQPRERLQLFTCMVVFPSSRWLQRWCQCRSSFESKSANSHKNAYSPSAVIKETFAWNVLNWETCEILGLVFQNQ